VRSGPRDGLAEIPHRPPKLLAALRLTGEVNRDRHLSMSCRFGISISGRVIMLDRTQDCVSAGSLGADRRRGHHSHVNKIKLLDPRVRRFRGQSSINIHSETFTLDDFRSIDATRNGHRK
jgi:hypothetical protein